MPASCRLDLMSPQAMGEFVTRLAAELVPGPVHAVGPDVGTGALLSAAAAHPDAFRSLVSGRAQRRTRSASAAC